VTAKTAEPVMPPAVEIAVPSTKAFAEKTAAVQPTPVQPVEIEPIEEPKLKKLDPAMAAVSTVTETAAAEEPVLFETKRETTAPQESPETAEELEPVILPELFEEPVGQGQPVPELTTALSPEPVLSELTQSEPDAPLELIEAEEGVAAPIAG